MSEYTYTLQGNEMFGVVNVFRMLNDIYGRREYYSRLQEELLVPSGQTDDKRTIAGSKRISAYMKETSFGRGDCNTRTEAWHQRNQRGALLLAMASLFTGVPGSVLSSLVQSTDKHGRIVGDDDVEINFDEENDRITITVVSEGMQKMMTPGGE
jgi:hypothetical protein